VETPQVSEKSAQRLLPAVLTHGGLFIVQACFASQAVESKWAMMPLLQGGAGMSPFGVAMVRMLGACTFFQIAAKVLRLPVPGFRDQAKLAGLSLMGIVLNQILFLTGLTYTTPATAALLAVTIPVATFAISAALGRERPTLRSVLGLFCAATGVFALIGFRKVDAGARLIAINCVFYAAYVVLSRETVKRLSAMVAVTWIFTWGALMFAPFGIMPLIAVVQAATPMHWLFLAYVVLVPTVLAYWLNAWALGRTNASLVTAYVLLQPIMAAGLGYVQLHIPLAPNLGIAGALVTLGLALVSIRPKVRARNVITSSSR
jgi:drug/metabolite transporter (DMT)-like permease